MTINIGSQVADIFLGGAIADYKAIQLIPTDTLQAASKLIDGIDYSAPSN